MPQCYFAGHIGVDGSSACDPPDCDEDQYCYGCGEHICDNHSFNLSLMGRHCVDDHLEPEEE